MCLDLAAAAGLPALLAAMAQQMVLAGTVALTVAVAVAAHGFTTFVPGFTVVCSEVVTEALALSVLFGPESRAVSRLHAQEICKECL